MLKLSEEFNERLELVIPFFTFFSLPEKEQIDLLPTLKETIYDFPDGDWITNNPLEVLIFGYQAHLNSLLIRLMILQDESKDKMIDDLVDLVEETLDMTIEISEKYFKIKSNDILVKTAEYKNICKLSSICRKKLNIEMFITKNIVQDCINYWPHP